MMKTAQAALRLPPLPSIRDILRLYDLRARRQLAQNFLLDPRVIERVVRAVGPIGPRDSVLEVGPGPGGITRALLHRRPARLSVVELDRRFLPILEGLRTAAAASELRMDIYNADILHFNLQDLLPAPDTAGDPPELHIVGNLPFNVSLPLLVRWLHDVAERRGAWSRSPLARMTLTFQKEVAERLVADIWSPARSRISVMAQGWCSVRLADCLSGGSFSPPPLVDVGVVRLDPLRQPRIRAPFPVAMRLVQHAFRSRRQHLVRCLRSLYPPTRNDLFVQLFRDSGIFPTRRSVELSVEEFADLCDVYAGQCERAPDLLEFDFRSREGSAIWRQQKGGPCAEAIQDEMIRDRFGVEGFSGLK